MRDFLISGYKSVDDYCAEHSISRSAFQSRKDTIDYIFKDALEHSRGTEGFYRLMYNPRETTRNPLHRLYLYKSVPDSTVRRTFMILSRLSRHPCTAGSLIAQIQAHELKDGEDASPDTKHTAVYDLLGKLVDTGIVECKKAKLRGAAAARSETVYSLRRTASAEALFRDEDYRDMLDFYSETAPFSVIGSYIHDKLCSAGIISETEPVFTYRYRYLTQCLDSEIMLRILYAIQTRRDLKLKTEEGQRKGKKPAKTDSFVCAPLRIYIGRSTGREYLVYKRHDDKRYYSVRLDKIIKADAVRRKEKESDMSCPRFWSPPYRVTDSEYRVVCEISGLSDSEYEELERRKRIGQIERAGDAARFVTETNDIRNTLFHLRRYTGRITALSCDPIEKQRWIDDIDKTLALYGEV